MKLVKTAVSPLLSVLGIATKTPKIPAAQPTATRDDAADMARDDERLRKRRGGAANILTGSAGAEASGAAVGRDTLGG